MTDDYFAIALRLSREVAESLRAQQPTKTIRDELLDLLASNGSVVVSGCNDETWAAIDQLLEKRLVRAEHDPEDRGLLLVVTLAGLKEAEGIRR